MKNKIVLIPGVLFAANVVYSIGQYCPVPNKNGGYIHNGLNSANSRSSIDDDGEKLVWKESNILKQMENERQLKNQCKKLEIRFLQRPLSMDKNGVFQNVSDGTISHVQIVAYDKVTGEYYDDFGYSFRNSILKEEKGMVFSEGEKQVRKLYNKNDLALLLYALQKDNDVNISISESGIVEKIINEKDSFEFIVSKKLKEHTTDRYKFSEVSNGMLMDGVSITLMSAFERLRNKVNYTDIVFNMMGDTFTLKELQHVYEAIENKKLLDILTLSCIAFKGILIEIV